MIAKCLCNNCGGHLEFESSNAGQRVDCPHCGVETLLYVQQAPLPRSQPPPATKSKRLAGCPECGHQISRKAEHCPGCGARLRAPWFARVVFKAALGIAVIFLALIAIGLLMIGLAPYAFAGPQETHGAYGVFSIGRATQPGLYEGKTTSIPEIVHGAYRADYRTTTRGMSEASTEAELARSHAGKYGGRRATLEEIQATSSRPIGAATSKRTAGVVQTAVSASVKPTTSPGYSQERQKYIQAKFQAHDAMRNCRGIASEECRMLRQQIYQGQGALFGTSTK